MSNENGGAMRGAPTRKGAAKREHLLAAAQRIVERDGIAALRHRGLADEAKVPLGTTTYYFADLKSLTAEVVSRVMRSWIREIDAAASSATLRNQRQVVDALVELFLLAGHDAQRQYEFLVSMGRYPDLAEVCGALRGELDSAVSRLLCRGYLQVSPGLVIAVADGAIVAAISEGRDPAATLRTRLAELFALL